MTEFFNLSTEVQPAEILRQWLSERPFEWGPALATRAAVRTFPWAVGYSSTEWIARYALPLFHSLFVAWSTTTSPIKGHKHAADLTASLLYPAAMNHEPEAYFASATRHIGLAVMAKLKLDKVDHSIRAIVALQNLTLARVEARPRDDFFWASIDRDINILRKGSNDENVNTRRLRNVSFVQTSDVAEWDDRLQKSLKRVLDLDASFSVWTEWFLNVAKQRDFGFIPGNGNPDAKVRDRQVASRLIHQVDGAFWTRDPLIVNRDIAGLIRTAAEGLLPEVGPVAQIPPQNDNAIAFQADTDGKIGLFNVQHYNALRDDEDTKDRYKECIQLAKDALDRCDRSNAASRLVGFLNNYIDAAGGKVADLRPSLFVQRGERLRQEISAYQLHDTMLPPLADDILLDLRTWRSAHNMLVGLDPALMARDTALFGPEDRVADVPPQEIEALAVDASEAGLLAENVLDIVLEATKLAPDIPDPKNRRTIWSFETGRNLVIEAFSVALRNPVKSLAGALVLGSAISTVGVAGSVLSVAGGSMPAARFLLRHREWIETRLGDTPTWKELFASVCEWMKGNTPPDPKN